MTTLNRIQTVTDEFAARQPGRMDTGFGTEAFATGTSSGGSDMMSGEGVALFTNGLLGGGSNILDGDRVGLFTTSV